MIDFPSLRPRAGALERRLPALRKAITTVLGIAVVVTSIAGCHPQVSLQGLVTNIEGEALPGVSVKVEEVQAFSVSNGNGWFGKRPNTLAVPPGSWDLIYIKSGFTTAHQHITTGNERTWEVPTIALWPLPAAKGIYVLEVLNYRPLTRATPERYIRPDNTPVFGMKQIPELVLDAPPEYLISHKMPNYDWQLTRLEQIEVLRPGVVADAAPDEAASVPDTIWAPTVRLPVQALPVDLPEQQLWQVRPAAAMRPGIYALHWGALEGDATTEESIYLIGIDDPDAPEKEEATAQDAPNPEET